MGLPPQRQAEPSHRHTNLSLTQRTPARGPNRELVRADAARGDRQISASRTSPRCAGAARGGARGRGWRGRRPRGWPGWPATSRASLSRPPRIIRISSSAAARDAARRCGTMRHSTPPSLHVERHQRLGGAAANARVELGADALGGEQLPVERRHDQRPRPLGDRAQRADEHAVDVRRGLALHRHLVDRLDHRETAGQVVEVAQQRREGLDRVGLADDVELAALVQQQAHVAERLEPGAELRLRLAHALGDGAHLAVVLGEHDDDAVGLAELVGAQHDGRVAVERDGHRGRQSSPPKRRCGAWNASIAVDEVLRAPGRPTTRRGRRARCTPAPTRASVGSRSLRPEERARGRARPSAGASKRGRDRRLAELVGLGQLAQRDDEALATVGVGSTMTRAPVDVDDAVVHRPRRVGARRHARTGAASATRRRPGCDSAPSAVIRSCHCWSVSSPHSASVPPTTMTWRSAGCSSRRASRSVVAEPACIGSILPRCAVQNREPRGVGDRPVDPVGRIWCPDRAPSTRTSLRAPGATSRASWTATADGPSGVGLPEPTATPRARRTWPRWCGWRSRATSAG